MCIRDSRRPVGDPLTTSVLLDEERAHARVGRVGELGHAPLGPYERCVVVTVGAAQLGDLKEAVRARQVAFSHSDLIGKTAREFRERLHDPRDPEASTETLAGVLTWSELGHLLPAPLCEQR